MARYGNANASSLIRAAATVQNKNNSYNDSVAAYEYSLSPKTADDFQKYQGYLQGRLAKTADPAAALTLTRTASSAYSSFAAADISRVTTSQKYGEASLQDKAATLQALREHAANTGNDALAQSLDAQIASTDIAMQQEQASAASHAESANNAQIRANTKAFNEAIGTKESLIKELNDAKMAGQITPHDFNDQMRQLYVGTPDGKPGLLGIVGQAAAAGDGVTDSGRFQDKLNGYGSDKAVQTLINGNSAVSAKLGNEFNQTLARDNNGNYSFQDRNSSDITGSRTVTGPDGKPLLDNNGHAVQTNIYADNGTTGTVDKAGKLGNFTVAGSIGDPTQANHGTVLRDVTGQIRQDDPSGVPYYINDKGTKIFTAIDPSNGREITSKDPALLKGMKGTTDKSSLGDKAGKLATDALDKTGLNGLTNPLDFYKHFDYRSLLPKQMGNPSQQAEIFRAANASHIAQVAKQTENARVALYNRNVASGQLAVATPNMVAAKTPNISVQPGPATPAVAVRPVTTQPTLAVKPVATQPSLAVSGPKYTAPVAQPNLLQQAGHAVSNFFGGLFK